MVEAAGQLVVMMQLLLQVVMVVAEVQVQVLKVRQRRLVQVMLA